MLFIISLTIMSFLLTAITLWAQSICDVDIDSLEIGIFEKDLCSGN